MIRFTVADCEVMELKSRLRLGEAAGETVKPGSLYVLKISG